MGDRTQLWNEMEGRIERLEQIADTIPRTPSAMGADAAGGSFGSIVQAYTSAGQSTTTSYANVQFNQEQIDLGGDYNPSTYVFTAPENGYYTFKYFVVVQMTMNATSKLGRLWTQAKYDSGTTGFDCYWSGYSEVSHIIAEGIPLSGGGTILLGSSDTLEIQIKHDASPVYSAVAFGTLEVLGAVPT